MRILIVKLTSIGDIVHTLPAFAAIRKAFPHAEISWVAEKRAAEILRGNHLINHLIEVDTRSLRQGKIIEKILPEAKRQFLALRRYNFDAAVDFQGLWKSAAIAKIARAKKVYGFSKLNLRESSSRLLLTKTFEIPPQINIIRQNVILAEKSLNFKAGEMIEFPIFTDEHHVTEAENIISERGKNFAILNPAGGWVTKLWHAEKFGALADRIWEENNLISLISTAPNEKDLAEKVLRNSKSGKAFAIQPSLKVFFELAKRAKIYVGGDTAPTHLAVAAKTPVVGIFGPTQWNRNGSPFKDDVGIERTDINCRINCHRRTCNKWICMDIKTDTVFEAVQARLRKLM